MYKIVTLLVAAFVMASCAGLGVREKLVRDLRNGDLVFVGIPMDYSLEEDSMEDAIGQATGDGDLNIIHVAIAEVDRDSIWIIDATIKHGVDRHPLDTFLRDFTLKDGSLPEMIVMRLRDNRHASDYVENSKAYLGLPYDVAFLPDNGALYCSELVRESYRAPDGAFLFENKPMNFLAPDGQMPLYWQQLFALIGQDVPQGIPGTNPREMSEAPVLRRVAVQAIKLQKR